MTIIQISDAAVSSTCKGPHAVHETARVHLDVSPLGVEQDVCVGYQQRRIHESVHRHVSMQPEPLVHLP